MEEYYILSVDSFQDTFTKMDSTKAFSFGFSVQNNESVLDVIKPGDNILVYRRSPLSGVNIYMKVISAKNGVIELEKKLEVAKIVPFQMINANIEDEYLAEISAEQFNELCKKMILGIGDICNKSDDDDMVSLKEQFEQYIVDVLQLKSTRQVREFEILSEKMIESGVIEKDVYFISDVEEYRAVTQAIKDSDEYQNYKNERKEKSPNSGLASDQGMTNYERFLIYLLENKLNVERLTGAENVLLYGVPGVGKSHEIQEKYCDDATRMQRVVFHPDYTYSDFVGQILPRVEAGQLKYIFTPGPFTNMLKKAWHNPEREYYLIIEEINRGNAPAIFGEIFQLLDRKTEDSHKFDPSEYGESEYAISNYDVATAVFGKSDQEIRIPSNMWILATMNTADQNVFTLDTAFQRRWNMRHMKNDVLAAGHAKNKIEGTEIHWGAFAVVINDMVMDINIDMASSEDKRLGAYFVKLNELSSNKFPEKVLKYLWDDAFKMEKDSVFDERFKSLEKVIETYEEATADKLSSVLKPEVYQKMIKEMQKEEEN